MNPISAPDTITKEMYIECRPETLFSFFTDAERLVRWMGRHVLLEPNIGGKFRIDINGSDIAMGELREIIPYEKVVMSWGWEKSKLVPPGSSTVTFMLTPQESGTLLTLIHAGLPASEIESHVKGWTHYMPRIRAAGEEQASA